MNINVPMLRVELRNNSNKFHRVYEQPAPSSANYSIYREAVDTLVSGEISLIVISSLFVIH